MDTLKKLIKVSILTLVPTNESKEKMSKIRDLIRSITNDEKYIKIKFSSDDELPLNKTIEFSTIAVVARAVFHESNKFYPQVFLDESLYKLKLI